MEAINATSVPTCWWRLHPDPGITHVAMVRLVVAAFSKHICRHIRHLTRSSHVSGTRWCNGSSCSEYGWPYQYRQRSGKSVLGLGLRSHYAPYNIPGDVPAPGNTFLDFAERRCCRFDDHTRVCRVDVLRRRLWHHACVCCRLFRI